MLVIAGSATQAYGCLCGGSGEKLSIFEIVTGELNRSTAVFSGKVVRFEWRKGIPNESRLDQNRRFGAELEWETKVVILRVDKWWKPSLPDEVAMVTEEVRMSNGDGGNSGCNYNFAKDKSYLVFARGPESELRTDSCSFTRELDSVAPQFLEALGKGNEPIKKFETEKPKLNSRLLSLGGLFAAG